MRQKRHGGVGGIVAIRHIGVIEESSELFLQKVCFESVYIISVKKHKLVVV